ncbi:hypothetical protein M0722_13810 [Microbacterium sp. KSW4-16]|uniref:hypothetical protein n=1 Tax=Microbacterium aurugineum TaxID=2851642 RepID=UPI0020C0253C|nr:hypothetical protein [Microbacterium aurugineum]MCK8468271.1 hypothetical protein [Microbacterium aurugineum]
MNTPRGEGWVWLSSVAVGGYLLPPVLLASLASFWDTTASADAQRGYRRALVVTVGMQVLATVVMCVFTVLTGAPWWVTVVFTAVGIAAMAAAVAVVPSLQRLERARPTGASGHQYGRAEFRRDLRKILVTMAVTLVAVAALIAALTLAFDNDLADVFWVSPLFALMAGAIACLTASSRVNRQIRDLVGGDLGRANRIGKVVVRGKDLPLSGEDAELVPAFASLSWVAQTYAALSSVLLVGSLLAMQVLTFADDPSDSWRIWYIALVGALIVAVIPLTVVQIRRTRTYASGDRKASQ